MRDKRIRFYHYTTSDAADSIIDDGVIVKTYDNGGPDAQLGTGVYGTKIPPKAGKIAIARNNWTEGWWKKKCQGKVDYFFEIWVPRSTVISRHFDGRHVYLYKGDLYLDDYNWRCDEVWYNN